MLRVLLGLILVVIALRAVSRLLHGIAAGIAAPRQAPPAATPLARDPVCGTYVVPVTGADLRLRSGHAVLLFRTMP